VGFGQTVCLPVGRKCGECSLAEKGLCPSAVVEKQKKVVKKAKIEVEGEGEVKGEEEVVVKEEEVVAEDIP